MGFWKNLGQSAAQLSRLQQSSESELQLTMNSTPLKEALVELLNQYAPEMPAIQIGPINLDVKTALMQLLQELTDEQILMMGRRIVGDVGGFVDQWSGQISESGESNMPSLQAQQGAENLNSPDGSSPIRQSPIQSSTIRNTAEPLGNGEAAMSTFTHGVN